ncbi:MAG: hypothetical protein PQJ50_01175 [Spirochaetales bacterium]|nr:hypothetical protein [Spirochaetales bacterium]
MKLNTGSSLPSLMIPVVRPLITAALFALLTISLSADSTAESPAGPETRIQALDTIAKPVTFLTDGLYDLTGIATRMSYQSLFLGGYMAGEDSVFAGSGYFKLDSTWRSAPVTERYSTYFTFGIEARQGYTDIAPGGLGPHFGYMGTAGVTFSAAPGWLGRAFWGQTFDYNRHMLLIGYLDVLDYLDFTSAMVPRMANFNGSTIINLTMNIPGSGFGVIGRSFVTDQFYLMGALMDANGETANIDFFERGAKFFSYGEIGWTPGQSQFYKSKINLGFWHRDGWDAGEDFNARERGYGFVFSACYTIDNWAPYFKFGMAHGGEQLQDFSVSGGFMYYLPRYNDLFGLGFATTRPKGMDWIDMQTAIEAVYRFQLSGNMSLSADGQVIFNHNGDNPLFVTGLGLRYAL